MTHYIIVKFLDTVSNKEELANQINTLFLHAIDIHGIYQVRVLSSCSNKANRHDLMIKMVMTPESLDVFDSSEIHQKWKDTFGKYIATKTIFDCDDF